MSVPPGTEMFQFPGFASFTYVFSERYPIGVGCPIRISTDQSLLAAPRGFAQRATSFIASWCQGIHRMPFSRSRRSPRALVPGVHHAQKPSSVSVASSQSPIVRDTSCQRHQLSETIATEHQTSAAKNDPVLDHLAQNHRVRPPIEAGDNGLPMAYTTHASEHIATAAGGPVPHEKPS
jgi:hypothetical protein